MATLDRVRALFGALDRDAAMARALVLAHDRDLNLDLASALEVARTLASALDLDLARVLDQARDLAGGLVGHIAGALDSDRVRDRERALFRAGMTARDLASALGVALTSALDGDYAADRPAARDLDLSRDLASALASYHALLRALASYPVLDRDRDLAGALQGFEQAAQMAGEARNPQRNVPRAVIGSVLVGTLLYLALEIAFIGALNPGNLVHGWANPVGKGDFGPYATLATGLGLGWLAVILYLDAFISPAGTGLIFVGIAARLSYALGHAGYVPRGVSRMSSRGVPYNSIILAFVVGLICFLPFPSWQSLVALVTSATVIMYAFAPITLLALRKADPNGARPYRVPAAPVLAPLAFIAANEIIYWTPWATVEKLMLAVVAGYLVFGISYTLGRPIERPPLDSRSLIWILPWFTGLTVISYLGQYGGTKLIPAWVDLGVVAVFSLLICALAVRLRLPTERITAAIIAADQLDTANQQC